MPNYIIAKAKPQLIRKRTTVITQQSVSVVISPNRTQTLKQQPVRQQPKQAPPPPPTPTPAHIRPRQSTPVSAISRQKLIKQRRRINRPDIKYVTRDPLPESLPRISDVRNSGRGRVLVIVGNGPSILEADLAKLKNHPKVDFLTVNKPDPRIWPTKYWAFFDQSQFTRHEDLWNNFEGIIFNSTAIKRQKSTSMQFKNINGKGWSYDLTKGVYIGRSSVFASMQIAMWLNYDHVYIFGCDMNPDGLNGQLHFYGNNPDVDPQTRRSRFGREAEFYDVAADTLTPIERARFTFCSAYNPHNFINKFNKLDHREAVDAILTNIGKL